MALIADSKGRQDEDSGYGRVFGNSSLGKLISRVHVCAIRNGNELEKLLWESTPYKSTLNAMLGTSAGTLEVQEIHVVTTKMIKSAVPGAPLTDFLILDRLRREVAVVELKDGDTFDTKKAAGERASAERFAEWIKPQVPYPVRYYFCAFNQLSKEAIVTGVKRVFALAQVMTGPELCERIGVDYAALRLYRQGHQAANREYFVRQLLAIPEIRELIGQQMQGN